MFVSWNSWNNSRKITINEYKLKISYWLVISAKQNEDIESFKDSKTGLQGPYKVIPAYQNANFYFCRKKYFDK